MSNGKNDEGFDIGYGKPPRNRRFRKGRSGNPKGRPKGTLNLATVLERALREPVVIDENGLRRTITKMEAAVKQLVNRAASGDLAALRQLLALVASAEQRFSDAQTERPSLDEADQKVMAQILERFNENGKED